MIAGINIQLYISLLVYSFCRVLATVTNSVVKAVFQIWSIVELAVEFIFPKYLTKYQNVKINKSKFKSAKSKK